MVAAYGLTGGIACGKSTVSHMFANLGVPVIDADIIAKQLVEQSEALRQCIITHFGSDVITTGTSINRPWLRQRIFENPDDKTWLEQLLHPRIQAEIAKQRQQIKAPYVILVIPLLIEHIDHYRDLTGIIVVDVDEAEQRQRLSARDKHDVVMMNKILATQSQRAARLTHADFVIDNRGDIAALEAQVQTLDHILRGR